MGAISDEITTALGRHFKCSGLADIDVATRERVADQVRDLVNEFSPFRKDTLTLPDAYAGILDTIHRDGIIIVPDFVSRDKIDAINAYFVERPGYQAHVPFYAKTPELLIKAQASSINLPVLSFSADVSLSCPELFDLIIDPRLMAIGAAYVGCFPTMYSLSTYYSHPTPTTVPYVHTDHRDHDCFRFLACFIYLSDVDEESGPFTFYPRTHKLDRHQIAPDTPPIPICAPAGTLILVDSWGIHRAERPRSRHRFAAWWRYGMGLNGSYFQDESWRYKCHDERVRARIADRPDLQYYLRGFV